MHSSRAVLRKPRSSFFFTFSKNNNRPIFTQATNTLANLGGGWNDRYKYSGNEGKSNCYYSWFVRSVCMGVVIGSGSSSFIAYADNSQQQFADTVDNKPKFSLFGGNLHACIHVYILLLINMCVVMLMFVTLWLVYGFRRLVHIFLFIIERIIV